MILRGFHVENERTINH